MTERKTIYPNLGIISTIELPRFPTYKYYVSTLRTKVQNGDFYSKECYYNRVPHKLRYNKLQFPIVIFFNFERALCKELQLLRNELLSHEHNPREPKSVLLRKFDRFINIKK